MSAGEDERPPLSLIDEREAADHSPSNSNVTDFSPQTNRSHLRMLEAILFASSEPLSEATLAERLPDDADVVRCLSDLQAGYAGRGVVLKRVAGMWAFRTADDLSYLLSGEAVEQKKLSRAALETLAVISYHQPVTRSEIEEVRGVSTNKGTLDVLLETGWIKMRGRRRTPGRPVTYGTTAAFLDHFGLDAIGDLPGLDELKGAGLLDLQIPVQLTMPLPDDTSDLRDDEEPLDEDDLVQMSGDSGAGGGSEPTGSNV